MAAAFLSLVALASGSWQIEAGPVTLEEGEITQVSGSFTIRAPEGTPAEAAAHSGGACLVADLVPLGIGLESCNTTAECNSPEAIDRLQRPDLVHYFGYCVAPDGSDEPPRCWTRPGLAETYCKRSIDGIRLTQGVHQLPEVPANPLGQGQPLPQWAVLACLATEGHPTACREPASEHRQISLSTAPPLLDSSRPSN